MRLATRVVTSLLLFMLGSSLALAAAADSLHGTVLSSTGTPIAGARVTITNQATGVANASITGPDGTFDITGLDDGSYTIAAALKGFIDYRQTGIDLRNGQSLSFQVQMLTSSVTQSVTVTAEGSPETSVTQAIISKREIEGVAGPFGSAAQALTAAPGVFVYGYGGVAATARSEVVVRGVKGGWSSVNGDILRNGISFLFDGIPMNNLIANNGQWQTTQIPIMDMISDISVDYGPGAPSNRWFDSLGGTVNYIPVQPKSTPGADITFGQDYGSYHTSITHMVANSGVYRGWSALLAAGYASNDTFRVGTIGQPTFNAPSSGYATFFKLQHLFDNGSIAFGYYHGRNTEFRPNFIPLLPITPTTQIAGQPANPGDAVTTTGIYGPDRADTNTAIPANVQYYSQATSGFYSSLASDIWYKHIKTQSDILYSKLQLALSPRVSFDSQAWYRHGYRLHDRVVNYYGPNYANGHEWYDPTSNVVGNKSDISIAIPHDQLTFGGYWIHSGYQNPVSTFNPALGTSIQNGAFFNADHLYNDYAFLFLQDRIDLLHKKLIITPGAAEQLFRTAYFNTSLTAFPNANPANASNLAPATHKNFLKFSPSVGAQFLALDWFTLHGNYAITYQNPTDSAFGANRGANGVNVALLQATKSVNSEAGFTVTKCPIARLGACSLDATYFHDKLSNVNVVTQVAQVSQPAAIALASSLNNGVSINFDTAPTPLFQVHGNAIIQHNYFLSYIPNGTTQDFGKYPISNNPKYSTNLGITSEIKTGNHHIDLTPGLWWQYVGLRYLFSNVNNAPTTQTMPGYGVVNFNMDGNLKHVLPGRLNEVPVKLSFGIENLLNRAYNPTAYITSGGYFGTSFGGYTLVDPGAPREYIVSINFNLK